jgi:putative resolvase
LDAYKTSTGMVVVHDPQVEKQGTGRIALYARVSSVDQKSDLDRQVQRLREYAATHCHQVAKEVTEIASGLNDSRPKFFKLLVDLSIGTIIMEHKDRGTRFGWNYITTLMEVQGRRIETVFANETQDDLVTDFISSITSMAACIYGRCGSRSEAERIKQCVEEVMKHESGDAAMSERRVPRWSDISVSFACGPSGSGISHRKKISGKVSRSSLKEQQKEQIMNKVSGIVGVFVYANDPKWLAEWYAFHFGLEFLSDIADTYYMEFYHSDDADPSQRRSTVFAIMPAKKPLGTERGEYIINYHLDDLAGFHAYLQMQGFSTQPVEEKTMAAIRKARGSLPELQTWKATTSSCTSRSRGIIRRKTRCKSHGVIVLNLL